MSDEIISGLVGGLFGTLVGKVIGRFRLWKVFVVALVILYGGSFLMGLILSGFKKTLPIFVELFNPLPFLIFVCLSAGATFVAYLGRAAVRKGRDGNAN